MVKALLRMNPRLNIFLLSIITALVILLSFNKCEKPVYVIPDLSHIKSEIANLKKASDSIKPIIIESEKTVVKTQTIWKQVRYDSLIPCEEILLYCDTLYQADSTLIAQQRWFIGVQNDIIRKQDTIIKSDSLTIKELSKKPKGRLKAFVVGFAIGFGAGAAIK